MTSTYAGRVVADQPEAWNAWYEAGFVTENGSADHFLLGVIVGAVNAQIWGTP